MGQYKVPQNVEAEDKIIGPLTFKQFIYALIGIGWGLVAFGLLRTIPAVMIIIGAPPVMLFLLLAFYQRDGQNFEQLLIALVGFFANSRKRLWRKEEVVETFHVQPRAPEVEQTQRNPAEIRSELDKLATLIDSRGWNEPVAANPDVVWPAGNPTTPTAPTTDRLVAPVTTPAPLAPASAPGNDVLDLQHSPLAQNLASLLDEAAADVRAEALEQMRARTKQAAARSTAHPAATISGVTTPPGADILKLATESDDLTVSQVAAAATRMAPAQTLAEGQAVDVRQNGNTAQ